MTGMEMDVAVMVIMAVGGAGLGLASLLTRAGGSAGPRWLVSGRIQGVFLLVGVPLFACFWGWRLIDGSTELLAEEPSFTPGMPLRPAQVVQGLTDRGRPITLLLPPTDVPLPPGSKEFELDLMVKPHLRLKLLQTDPPNPYYNCHGWVFAGGQYWVVEEQVAAILADNGYALVPEPQAGDLAAYRQADGVVIHTGVVRWVGEGRIMVESKWGVLGRYLHASTDHFVYTATCQFYRTERPEGHRLRGLTKPPCGGFRTE